ncbi:MAG: BatD family protein [Agriterribacter sp.]
MKHIDKYLLRPGIYLLFFFLCQHTLFAQVRAVASANKQFFVQDDLVKLQFSVENADDVQQFIPPSFKGCKIVQGPIHVSGSSNINGAESKYLAFVYVLQPQLPGKYSFSGASAKVNGKRLVFNTLNVQVKKMPHGGGNFPPGIFEDSSPEGLYSDYIIKRGENLQDKIRKNLFIKVDVDKASCYEGEPVVATYKLYTRLRSESKVTRRPSFNGFSVYDMIDPSSASSTIEKLNGRDFNVYLIRRAQLFPLQSGNLELDKAEVENTITFLKADYAMRDKGQHLPELLRSFENDNTGSEGVEMEKVTIESNPVSVNVKALPEVNKPDSFDGAVGSFSIQANVDKKTVALKDAAVLKVIIKGEGNFGVLNMPAVHWPKDVEVFEPSAKEDFLKSVVPMRGYKSFEYTFMPKRSGTSVIPAVNFTYFDPKANQYRTIATDSIHLNVVASQSKNAKELYTLQSNAVNDIGFNRYWIMAIAGVLLIGFGIVLLKYIQTGSNNGNISGQKKTQEYEKTTKDENTPPPPQPEFLTGPLFKSRLFLVQQDSRSFYSELGKALRNHITEKLQPSSSYLEVKKIESLMRANGVDELIITQFNLVIHQCEIALYTPTLDDADMQSVYDVAEDVIEAINKK